MTKRVFEDMATSFRMSRPDDETSEAYRQWWRDVQAMAGVCKRANARFDSDLFYEWCKRVIGTPATRGL